MFKKSFLPALVCSFILLLGVSFILAGPPSIAWDKEECSGTVSGYATDSGSFALWDGYEFTHIGVEASVQNGNNQINMRAESYISLGGISIYVEAEANGRDSESEYENVSGQGYNSCNEWYWTVDARNNGGNGNACCKWAWTQVD